MLQSSKEEYWFTNQALLRIKASNASTTFKLMARFDFKTNVVDHVEFETVGCEGHDCNLKFHIRREHTSIDVAKAEASTACEYYKVLMLLSRTQHKSEWEWEFAKVALE